LIFIDGENVICTGNCITRETIEWLKTLCPNCNMIRGDYEFSYLSEFKVFQINNFKIVLVHDH